MPKPTIEQYLLISGSLIMDELNEQYGNYLEKEFPKLALKESVNERFSETDLTMRLGHPFRQMAHYNVVDPNVDDTAKKNHDLFIESKEYKIEVKFLKNWRSYVGTASNKKVWDEYQRDFNWLANEIANGRKGKSSFVVGWFNCLDYFAQAIQLGAREEGKRTGSNPIASENRIVYFPFLRRTAVPTHTKDLAYDYRLAYTSLRLNLNENRELDMNCMFLGSETDVFHFAIYY